MTLGPRDAQDYAAVVAACGSCEQIDDDPQTSPLRRILRIAPGYNKAADGPIAAQRIGLGTMRAKCPHFDEWLTRLESLAEEGR